MSQSSDQMELREEDVVKHYEAALAMMEGFDHAPRIGVAKAEDQPERSSGIGTRRRFRSTTPGLATRFEHAAAGCAIGRSDRGRRRR